MNFQASFPRNFTKTLLLGATTLALVGAPTPPVRAQQITDPSPSQAATNVDPNSPISASFRTANGVSVRPETVRITLDGQDITNDSIITRDFFSYTPSSPLPPGTRQVLLEFTNTRGVTRRVTWNFNVGNPIRASIESVVHNAGNRPLGAGEILLVTIQGTPSSQVSALLVQDGRRVQNLRAQEVSPGTYVVNVLVQARDTTTEGILVARLANGGQVRFATAEQPVRLIQGARGNVQTLSSEDISTSTTGTIDSGTGTLLPQITNVRDGDRVSGSAFTLQGTTAPNATVQVRAVAETSLGGLISAQQTIANQSIQANGQGQFSFTLRPPIPASGTIYRINLTSSAGGQTSPTVSLQLTQQ